MPGLPVMRDHTSAPNPTARLTFRDGLTLGAKDEVITYCARNLEPYRGFHIFMRALPQILDALPNAHILILGGDGVSYGRQPNDAANWRKKALQELDGALDLARVHFRTMDRPPYTVRSVSEQGADATGDSTAAPRA